MNNQFVVGGAGDVTAGGKADYKDNLYLAVNGEWQQNAKIPEDKPRTGGFSDLDQAVEKTLMNDFDEFAEGQKATDSELMEEAVKLYRLALDTDRLDREGFTPVESDLNKILLLNNLQDLNNRLSYFVKNGYSMPFAIQVDADMKDTKTNVVYVYAPDLILPDKTYYGTESGDQLLKIFKETAIDVLQKIGYSQIDAETMTNKAVAFDEKLVPLVKSSEDWADYTKMYNPVNFFEFTKSTSNLNIGHAIQELVDGTPEKIIVTEPNYFEKYNELVNESNFSVLKSWMFIKKLLGSTSMLSEDLRQAGGKYNLAISGSKTMPNRKKSAYYKTSRTFSEVIGVYYGKNYFGEEAKLDVHKMVENMINIYQQRIRKNTWLGEETKDKAIVKLNHINIKVGYPDKIDPLYSEFKIDDSQSLYQNLTTISKQITLDNFAKYHKPVDCDEWGMPGHMVNAQYDPSRNDITFPAAILQAPFYSLHQSASQNYGGIGSVIAHEISHAFDNNGAKFDEYGNMNNWWTEQDYASFKDLTQDMIDEFDGVEYAGGKINGKLVVSENVADAGGLSCALEATKNENDYDLREFFINWARVWRIKATNEFSQLQLKTDVHAPGPMRANIQAQNMDDFYSTFDVHKNDGMWLEKGKRVNIW